MEERNPPQLPRKSLAPAVLAAFVLGSFSGAAFGVLFALSLDERHFPWRTPASPTERIVREQVVSAEDSQVILAVRAVSPSVVSIVVSKDIAKLYDATGILPFEDYFGPAFTVPETRPGAAPQMRQVGGGTGFVISADGLILTNRHVVSDVEAEYEVVLSDGRGFPANVLAIDPVLDVAVLKIEASELPVAPLGDSSKLQIGETVIAIGNALSELQNTVTKGVISGINRRVVAGNASGSEVLEEAIQTDAAINPGNSGGPLIDLRGKVVGINTAVNRSGQSIGFAIPIDAVKVVVDSIRSTGRIVRPWLGVRYVLITPEAAKANGIDSDHGALIVKGGGGEPGVAEGSPAEAAGLKEGDLLLEVDGLPVDLEHPLSSLIGRHRSGDAMNVTYRREGADRTVLVTLGELPADFR